VFDTLSDRLRKTLAGLTGRGRVSEADVDAAMREVRLALLEADIKQSETLRFELGLRMTHLTFAREADTPEAESLLLELVATYWRVADQLASPLFLWRRIIKA